MTEAIDLRSDTVTRPTDAMRAAMAAAPVGDDQYGEDPSTNRLQARVAELLGKEAALWLPTGTMANQVALRTFTRPGDEVVASRESHAAWHELGGAAANAGVQIHEIGQGGLFTADDLRQATKPRSFAIFPTTTLVEVENTHNRAGGVVVPQALVVDICGAARELGLASFLDGARLWNASAASGVALHKLAEPFDVVAVAFSKGLGAPGGSMLAGRKDTIAVADRHRRRMGGAMRQNGIFSAAALHALDHHLARLPEDHANARALAEQLLAHAPAAGLGHRADQHRGLSPAAATAHRCAHTLRASTRTRRARHRLRSAHGACCDALGCEPRAVPARGGGAGRLAGELTAPVSGPRLQGRGVNSLSNLPILKVPLTRTASLPSAVMRPWAKTMVSVERSTCASPCTQAPSGAGAM